MTKHSKGCHETRVQFTNFLKLYFFKTGSAKTDINGQS